MSETRKPNEASRIVRVLEDAWCAIQDRYPEVPDVYVTVGKGSHRGGLTLGHFGAFRWFINDDDRGTHELFLAGEGIRRGPVEMLNTLLHEAAHALAAGRGIKDTSRGGRYHNHHFKLLTEELGLDVAQVTVQGWASTSVPEKTQREYIDVLAYMEAELTRWRESETPVVWSKVGGTDSVKTVATEPGGTVKMIVACDCDRRIRIASAVLDAGSITCGRCGEEFARRIVME